MALALAAATAALAFSGPAPAHAGSDSFCYGSVPAYTECGGPQHSLTGVEGTNYTANQGCGGAINYASYVCGNPSGCHSYNGSTVRTPGIKHNSSTAKNMGGESTWGSTGSLCGSFLMAEFAETGAAVLPALDSLPAFSDRSTTLPADVADLFPGANGTAVSAFTTPKGKGWVVSDTRSQELCIAIDDAGTGYGTVCTTWAAAARHGVAMSVIDPAEPRESFAVDVPAEGDDGVIVSPLAGQAR